MNAAGFYTLPDDEQVARLTRLASAAACHWDGGFTDLALVKYRENAVFSARRPDGQRVAVRIHRHGYHGESALASELHWMNELRRIGSIEVPPILPAANGKLSARVAHYGVPEPRQVSVLGWLTGAPVGTSEAGLELSDEASVALYFDAGVLAATLHKQSTAMDIPDGFTRHSWDEHGLVGDEPLWGRFWQTDGLSEVQCGLLQTARAAALSDLGALGKGDDVYGLIHADFVPENLLTECGRLKLIDFDDAGYGWHMFELATALYFTLEDPRHHDIASALFAGYRSVRTLTEHDERLLPLFLFVRGTTYVGWVQSRPETETAKTLGPMLVERVCMLAERYLVARVSGPTVQNHLSTASYGD